MCLLRQSNGFFPASLSRATISQAGRLPSLCRPLASLNCVFYKNTFRGLAPGRKRADRRHEAWLSCSGGRVARNILTAQPTRLPLAILHFNRWGAKQSGCEILAASGWFYLPRPGCSSIRSRRVLSNSNSYLSDPLCVGGPARIYKKESLI